MNDIKVVFMGTPDFSVPVLEMLIANYNVVLIVTNPDKPVGRGGKVAFSPVKEVALKNNIPLFQPEKIRVDYEDVLKMEPDLIVTCAYGQIIPKEVLDYPRLGCVNVHASLLPKYRGGAPIHHAIINGDKKTGITIMYMDVGMDSGDIIAQKEIPIENDDTAETLFSKLSLLGSDFLKEILPSIINGTNNRIKQNEEDVTIAHNISPTDEIIDFTKTREEVYNQIRGLNSWPGAYTYLDGKRLKVWMSKIGAEKDYQDMGVITNIYKDGVGVSTKDGEIILTELQIEGKKKMTAHDYLNGLTNRDELVGKKLG